MVRLAKCDKCGGIYDQVWSEKRTCPECGSSVTQIEVDTGYTESLRKVFLGGGVAMFICALVLVLLNLIEGGTKTTGWISFAVFVLSIIFFLISLLIIVSMSRKAIEAEKERSPLRRLRKRVHHPKKEISRGRVESPGKGRKIPVVSHQGLNLLGKHGR